MKQVIHVAQDAIRKNMKTGSNDPAIIVRTYRGATRHHRVAILDAAGEEVAVVIHDQRNPLSCGARVWIETQGEVRALV